MLSQKRRKKRQSHGLKTVELQRGKQGYGFTISGQQPCLLGVIISGSPADEQGLKDGDHLVTVNGLAVSQLSHEKVVRVIGSCSGILKVQIAEVTRAQVHHNDSDSSDEQYVKPRYTHRTRSRSNSKTAHLPSEPTVKKPTGASQLTQHAASLGKGASLSLPPRDDAFPTIYHPMRPINGRASDFGVIRQSQQQEHQEHRVGDYYRQGFNSRGQVVPGYNGIPGPGQLVRSNSVPDISALDSQATDLSKILYPAMQPMAISSSSTINIDDDQPSLKVIVGYIGSIEMPQDSNLPSSRLQSIRSAVRRLRVEQKVHTLVLLEIRSDGIKLINPMGSTIVHYPVNRLAMSGMYPDDKRFFGLVTIQEEDQTEVELSSSCHVFMVDPEFAKHNVHSAKAKIFGIHCTIDPSSHRCIEFPKSCSPILRTAAKLYKDKHGGIFDVPRRNERLATSDSDTNSDSGLGFHKDQDEQMPTADRVYVVDIHIPDNNSDLSPGHSGERVISPVGGERVISPVGGERVISPVGGERVIPPVGGERVIPPVGGERVIFPVGASGLQRSQTPVKSGASGYTRDGLGGLIRKIPPHRQQLNHSMSSSAFTSKPILHNSLGDTRSITAPSLANLPSSSLTPSAQISTAISPAAVTQTAMDPRTVEQLRSNMQRLLAMRKENIRDTQSLSDTESVMSDVRSRGSSGSRVSFNPRVSIATHNYPVVSGAVGGISSGSDSSSYIRKRDLSSQSSLFNDPPTRIRRYRNVKSDSIDQTPKSKPPPPPVPPKPNLSTQRALDDISQQEKYIKQQHQEAMHKRQLQQRRHQAEDNLVVKSLTLDDRLSRTAQNYAVSSRVMDSLDSKLSPRAYPSIAPRPTKMTAGERSAFQKVSPEPANNPPLNFYTSRNYNENNNNNNNNNNSQTASNSSNSTGSTNNRTAANAVAVNTAKPVPAPRRLSRAASQENTCTPSRSCSVPPIARAWFEVGRELNVDDGLSVRSTSAQSMENQYVQGDRLTPADGDTGGLKDKAISTESLVEVGTRSGVSSNVTVGKQPLNNNNVGRVASWAVSFENLLQDDDGLKAFTEYLKLEYSEENIKFWLACEHFKTVTDPAEQRRIAIELYDTHIGGQNSSLVDNEVVNIDSRAAKQAEQQLGNPSHTMFDEAQSQVFRLMKTDSYTRFIKSEFYQTCLVREFEHNKEKTGPSSLSSESSDTQKRRTFPNFFKDISRSFTNRVQYDGGSSIRKPGSRSSDDSSLERVRPSASSASSASARSRKYEGSLTADIRVFKNRLDSGGSQDEADEERLLRVVLPDGSTSVIQAKQSDSLRSLLATLLSKKTELAINSIDVFPLESDRALDISQRLTEIPHQELRVERRAIVRLELPNKRPVGVKAKPHRTIRDVVRPMLQKYGYNIEQVVIAQNGEPVNQDLPVLSVDNVRLTITQKEQFQEWGISRKSQNPHDGLDDLVDFEDILSQDMQGNGSLSKKSKGSQLFGMLKNYSLDDSKATLRKSKGKNVTFGPTKSMDDRYLTNPSTNDKFLEMVTKMQSCRLNDQRGLSIDVGELPEFLKSGSDQQSETDEGSMSPPQSRLNRDAARSSHAAGSSAYYSDQTSTSSSEAAVYNSEGVSHRTPQHMHKIENSLSSHSQLNNSYHRAISAGEDNSNFDFPNKHADMNSTLMPGNRTADDTLTPARLPLSPLSPLSPLPTNLPPPPQFGNEATTSTPINASGRTLSAAHSIAVPPPYSQAISRSSIASSFNSNNSNNISGDSNSGSLNRGLQHVTTIPGNNPGNRLSVAHHQPMIFHDEDEPIENHSDRSTPSPTTHSLVLTAEEPLLSNRDPNDVSTYNFYESQYKNVEIVRSAAPTEPVKVTFV